MKLELKHLAPYLPYNTRVFSVRGTVFLLDTYSNMKGTGIESRDIHSVLNEQMKPILRPLSDLTKYINYGLSTYAFVDLFEIGDCDGCVFEFEHGNIKTIKALENISKYNSYNDINYLPNAVVNMMYEHHFDVFGLIEQGLAIDINTLNK